jgi:inhibitor of KinA sporulation pathway (predicted exonuclease)
MNYLIVDLEATCWEKKVGVDAMEIIEIGAVKLDGDNYAVIDEFQRFVKPAENPRLSDFCTKLTSITQKDVDGAEFFESVFADFLTWAGPEPYRFCSWSTYDLKQFREDCARRGVEFPEKLESHIDLQQLYSAKSGSPISTMEQALKKLDIPLDGAHHRALDDSRNIAKIAISLFKAKAGEGVKIIEYDSGWPKEFEAEAARIRAVLGGHIKEIEHVGSTALPGVAAKPTIDLMIGVATLEMTADIVGAFEKMDYRYFGEYSIPGRHFFRKGKPPTHHVHWVESGSEFWKKQLLFRDFMRSNPEDCARYVSLKKELAVKYKNDRDKYTLAKTEFIEEINRKAAAWSR